MDRYEYHKISDKAFPVIFHFDFLKRNQSLMEHWHEYIEILYCVEGDADMIIEGRKVPIRKGGITVVNSRFMHYPRASKSSYAKYYCLIFSSSLLEQAGIYLNEGELADYVESQEANSLFEIIIKEMKDKKHYYKDIVKSQITALISYLRRNSYSAAGRMAGNRMIEQGIEYLREHFKENISIDDLVKEIGYSRYYFCRQFKKHTAYTVNEYIRILRCNEAEYLIENSAMSISSVASECGFDDVSYFTKVFKKQTGILPSKVRRKNS